MAGVVKSLMTTESDLVETSGVKIDYVEIPIIHAENISKVGIVMSLGGFPNDLYTDLFY